jgi:hypothetical protein
MELESDVMVPWFNPLEIRLEVKVCELIACPEVPSIFTSTLSCPCADAAKRESTVMIM